MDSPPQSTRPAAPLHETPTKIQAPCSASDPSNFGAEELSRASIKQRSETKVPGRLRDLASFLADASEVIPVVEWSGLAPEMEACILRKTFVHPSAPYTLENSTLPSIPLGDSWVNHYKRLLRDTYPWVKRLEHFQALGQAPTESSWRSYVYTHSESIFLDDPELHAECNSQLNTTAKHHPAKTSRPDVSMGVVSSVAPNVLPGCRTGSLSLCFADGEEKRHPNNKSDEAKLLCVMSARMHHIKTSLKLPTWSCDIAVGGSKRENIPLPVAVGTLRCGSKWSVYLMWRRENRKPFQWAKIIDEKDLGKPDEFLHYTTFTFRLFCYGQMFKKAVKTIIADLESETEESDEEGELEVSEAEADDHGHSPLPEQPPVQAQQGGQPSKGPATSEPVQGDRQWDQMHVFSRDKDRGYNITLGGTRQDGLYVVRKNSKLHAPKRHRREVNAYKLLRDQGVMPKLLGHWKDVTTEHLVMELEYQPSICNYYPTTMKELRQYMVSILQILAHLHDMVGMIHRDIKRTNILAYKTSSGDVEVKLVDFEFSYLFTQPFKECDGHYGTYGYISPECWDAWYGDASLEEQKQTAVTGAGDMFALGVILVEFLFGIWLDGQQRQSIELTRFLGEVMTAPGTTQHQGHQLVKDHRTRLKQFIRQLKVKSVWTCDFRLGWLDDGGEALDLAQSLTRHAPGDRLTAAQVLVHPFLNKPRAA